MFGVGGIADGFAIILILASLGIVLIAALVLTFVLKIFRVRFHKAFIWGFGLPIVTWAASLGYLTWFAPERSRPKEVPVPIPLPNEYSSTE
jgi:hypothetical protein